MASTNAEVAKFLETVGDVLEIMGDSAFRVAAYREAARRVSALNEEIVEVHRQGRLESVSGIGPSIATKVAELIETGRSSYLEKMQGTIPASLVELLSVPGLGPSKARQIHSALNVRSLEDLALAAREGRLRTVPGIGEATEAKLLREIERLRSRSHRMLLSTALEAAEQVADYLRDHPAVERIEPAGSIRRRQETIGDIDLLVGSDRPLDVMRAFTTLPIVKEIIATGPTKTSILTHENLQIDLRVVPARVFGVALQHFTGGKAHNIAVRDLAIAKGFKLNEYGLFKGDSDEPVAYASEEDVYEALGLQFPPPEIRQNTGEIEAAGEGRLPSLVTEADIRGDLHVHTNWSDGSATLETMVKAAVARGYEYLAVTDHSQGLGVANGLTMDRVREQRKLVDELNRKYAPFHILAGIELEIRGNGALDFPDELLAEFDIVGISLHSGGRQPREKLTMRLANALANPFADVLNHPTGRLIGRRDPYDIDLPNTIALAVRNGVALEINSSPDRLDLSDHWARRAMEAGARLVINTDSHSPNSMDTMRYGISVARRAWLEPKHILNTLPLKQLLRALRDVRRAA